MSFHLAHLQQAGSARSRRQATAVIYTAVPEAPVELVTYLLNECCGGRPKPCATRDRLPERPVCLFGRRCRGSAET